MSFGGSGPQYQTTGATTTTSTPWTAAQPFLQYAMNRAKQFETGDTGYKPWTGATQAAINPQLQSSFNSIQNLVKNNQLPQAATDYAQGILGGQMPSSQAGEWAQGMMSGGGVPSNIQDKVNALMQSTTGKGIQGPLTNQLGYQGRPDALQALSQIMKTGGTNPAVAAFAQKQMGYQDPKETSAYLRNLVGGWEMNKGKNPYMDQMLDANADRINNQMASSMAGSGRFGSFAHGDAMAESIAEANNPLLAQTYENAMGRRTAAANQLAANALAAQGVRQSGAGLLSNETQQGTANRMGAAGALHSQALQNANVRSNAASALAGISNADRAAQLQAAGLGSTNWQNQLGAQLQGANLSNNIDQANYGRQMQMAALAPQLNELQFSDANRMGSIGQYYQNRDQANLQGNIAQWDATQARPWEQLSRYMGTVGGMGGLGGTKTAIAQTPQAPFGQSVLGGAMVGGGLGSMFGPWGTGLGALGGGIMGAFA